MKGLTGWILLFFQYTGSNGDKISSMIRYCNGKDIFIEIRGDVVCAGLKTLGNSIVEICTEEKVRDILDFKHFKTDTCTSSWMCTAGYGPTSLEGGG